jgi:hypothetical protein
MHKFENLKNGSASCFTVGSREGDNSAKKVIDKLQHSALQSIKNQKGKRERG